MDPPLDASVVFNTEPEPIKVNRKGSETSQKAASQIAAGLSKISAIIAANESMLGDLDAVAGDGDHGAGMTRGTNAAAEIAQELVKDGAGAQTTLVGAGARWAEQAGGASGALWGAALTAAGNALGDEGEVDLNAQVKAVHAFVNSIMGLGGANIGDKTMVDAQLPFAKELERCVTQGHSASDSWKLAAGVSANAANATTNLVAKMGRARVLGEKSLGSADPGAISFSLIVSTIANML